MKQALSWDDTVEDYGLKIIVIKFIFDPTEFAGICLF